MTQQIINVGTVPNDETGDPLPVAFGKINANFSDIYGGGGPAGGSDTQIQYNSGGLLAGAAITYTLGTWTWGPDALVPQAMTVSMPSVPAGNTNTSSAATLTILGSKGTGTGNGGDILFRVAPPGTTGSAQNAYTNAFRISGTTGAMTFAVNGTTMFAIGFVTLMGGDVYTGTIHIGGNVGGILSSNAAAFLQFGNADAAAPISQTLRAQSVVNGTTDTSGANLTIQGSRGTGTGVGGNIIFQVAPKSTTGSFPNSYSSLLTLFNDKTIGVTAGFTVANLPAAGTVGRIARVTDGAAGLIWGATVTGGGSTAYMVWDSGANWVVFSGPVNVSSSDVQIFTSSGTWTKPSNATATSVTTSFLIGGGGGGGGGALTTGVFGSSGGCGGGGGEYLTATIQTSTLAATVAVTVAVAANGGIGAHGGIRAAGTAGSNGGNTTFGALTAYGGGGGSQGFPTNALRYGGGSAGSAGSGAQGSASAGTAGLGGGIAGLDDVTAGNSVAAVPINSNAGGAGGGSSATNGCAFSAGYSAFGGAGGGAGMGITIAGALIGAGGGATSGGGGGNSTAASAGGVAGPNANGSAGVLATGYIGGAGAGGGGGTITNNLNAGNGGDGTGYGSGGGGGGSGLVGGTATAGNGGAGGPGLCVVITTF